MSGYKDGSGWSNASASGSSLPWYAELLRKSASAVGFFLNDYTADMKAHMAVLSSLLASGRLQAMVDDGSTRGSAFRGVEQVADAIDYLYAGQNIGKVVVRIAESDVASGRSKL
jgi:NADPH-dependent curcumin reductase CurA